MPMTEQQKKWLAGVLVANGVGRSVPVALGGTYGGDPSGSEAEDDDPASPNGRPAPMIEAGLSNGKAGTGPKTHGAKRQGAAHPDPDVVEGTIGTPSDGQPGNRGGGHPAQSGATGPLGISLPAVIKAVEQVVQQAVKALQDSGIGQPLVQPDLGGIAGKAVQGMIDAARKKAEATGADAAALEKHAKELLAAAGKRIAEGVKTVQDVVHRIEKANKDLEAGKQKMADDARKTIEAVKEAARKGGEKILDGAVDAVRTIAKDAGLEQQERQLEAAAMSVKQRAETAVAAAETVVQDIGVAERKFVGGVADMVRDVEKTVETGVTKTLGDAEAAAKGAIADIFG